MGCQFRNEQDSPARALFGSSIMMSRAAVLACLCLGGTSAVRVNRVPKYNQALNVLERKSTSAGGTVQYLGIFDGIDACEQACLDTGANSPDRCNYYIYFPTSLGSVRYASQCYSVTSPGWNPSYDETAVTGAITWPCQTDSDCSLNGVCNDGSCDCRTAWSGERCETLNVMPTTHHSGYRGTDGGHNTSSWGGAVLEGADGKFHMWASEMTEHWYVREPPPPPHTHTYTHSSPPPPSPRA